MAYTSINAIRFTVRNSINYIMDKNKTALIQKLYDGSDDKVNELLGGNKLSNSVDYAFNRDKTETTLLESAVNCNKDTAYKDMMAVKIRYGKIGGVQGYHLIQSFAGGEVTPELAHRIAGEFMERLLGSGFQAVYSTHLNTGNIHNHIVWNSVGLNGMKYRSNAKGYYEQIRGISDELCRKYGLSIIYPEQGNKSKSYAEVQAERRGEPTWRSMVRKVVDRAIEDSFTFPQFLDALRADGFEIKPGKRLSVRPPGKERFIRLDRLGEGYSEAEIRERIVNKSLKAYEQRQQQRLARQPTRQYAPYTFRRSSLKSVFSLHGLRGLYFHYLYKMGVLPKKHPRPDRQAHFLLMEDIRHLQKRMKMSDYLAAHGIETLEQLHSRQGALRVQTQPLLQERKMLYRVHDGKARAAGITARLKPMWKEIRLCGDIEKHSIEISKKLQAVKRLEQQQQRMEDIAYDERNRRGGPDREIHPRRN